ncbi:hypothetical protein JCM19233_4938 [Vibrio astriarenae]|nr:hypothetical protein JCM19233_4938 [Vibrio sp. C7]
MFLLFPYLLGKLSFWFSLFVCAFVSLFCFWVVVVVARSFGVDLI